MTWLRRAICSALISAMSVVMPVMVHSQVTKAASIRGQLIADTSGAPVAGAELVLVEIGRSARSSVTGEFAITDVPPGLYVLQVRHPRFQSLEDTVRAIAGDSPQLRIRLTALAVSLAAVTIRAEQVERSPLMADFRRRRETTNGKFLTGAEIRKIGSQNLVNLVRGHIGGFDIVRHPSGMGSAFASRRAASPRLDRPGGPVNECYSSVWINGQLLYYLSPTKMADPPRIEDFDVAHLNGLEFYRGAAETPLEFNVMTAACGTVVIWMDLR